MFEPKIGFSGFAIRDLEASRAFYADTLGLQATVNEMGFLDLTLPGGARIMAYQKDDHEPANFTVLNFLVDDIDEAVDDLNARGVPTKIYTEGEFAGDEKGVVRGGSGQDIPNDFGDVAWFLDPSGNVVAVMAGVDVPPAGGLREKAPTTNP
jgi:catechol 2,3-dioxygenase-like lactoylglutathione lyase family enzyme